MLVGEPSEQTLGLLGDHGVGVVHAVRDERVSAYAPAAWAAGGPGRADRRCLRDPRRRDRPWERGPGARRCSHRQAHGGELHRRATRRSARDHAPAMGRESHRGQGGRLAGPADGRDARGRRAGRHARPARRARGRAGPDRRRPAGLARPWSRPRTGSRPSDACVVVWWPGVAAPRGSRRSRSSPSPRRDCRRTRAVTSLGWRPHAQQIGQTGTKIAPELYIACGISVDPAHRRLPGAADPGDQHRS